MEKRSAGGSYDQTPETSQSIIFTYYHGDINTVVDEHFFRALNKTSMPKDLSTKPREIQRPSKSDLVTPNSWSPSWSKHGMASTSTSGLSQGSSEEPVQTRGVIMGPTTLSTNPWPYPNRQGSSYELMYRQSGTPQSSSSSFLHLLHMDRHPGGTMVTPSSKPDMEPEWGARSTYRDSGVQMPEKSKDVYWY